MENAKEFTSQNIHEARLKTLKDKDVYSAPFNTIGKIFLKEFLGYSVFYQLSFEEVRSRFIVLSGAACKDIPNTESDFYKFICGEYLSLEREPRNCLLSLYLKATEDLAKIQKNIYKCDQKIDRIGQEKKRDSTTQSNTTSYDEPLFKYYKESNIATRDEIIDFMTSEAIHTVALRRSFRDSRLVTNIFETYSYQINPNRYDPDNFTEISNKFLELGLSEFQKLEELYKNNQELFYQRVDQYISDQNIIDKIRERVNSHHLLNNRKQIILPALDAYAENKQIFLSLIPLQIEGIFYDYCLELGIPENKLDAVAIGGKLDYIKRENPRFYDFEYFKFVFPITRNEVAHGKIIAPEEINRAAAFMLLDLADVSERISTDPLPIKTILTALKRVQNNLPCFDEDLINIAFFMAVKKQFPTFYNMDSILQAVKSQFSEDRFFRLIKDLSQSEDYTLLAGMKTLLKWLKEDQPGLEQKCADVFREIDKTEQILRERRTASKHKSGDISLFDFFNMVSRAAQELYYGQPNE